nr:MAG TPA: endosialidase chaperone [Caudoviricetes sp.]
MASGTIYGSTSNKYITGRIVWSSTTDINNNTSTVSATLSYYKDSSYSNRTYSSTFEGSITINGSTKTIHKYDHDRIKLYRDVGWVVMDSYSVTVPHNTNGTKSIVISATGKMVETTFTSTSLSETVVLDTIPRASIINSLSCSTSYFDGTLTYKYTPQSSSYYNRCNISLNINNDFIAIKSIKLGTKSASQQTATVTLSSSELSTIYEKLPSGTSGTLRFTFRTYSDSSYSTQVGDASYKEVKLTIPTSIKPSIGTITLSPVKITTADGTPRNILVKGKNKLNISVSGCAAGAGSSIVSYTFSGQNISSTVSSTATNASATSNTMSASGEFIYTVTIKDKRGRTASKTASITCQDYNTDELKFSSFTVYRCKSDGTEDNNGTYIKYDFKVNYPSVGNTNKGTVKIYYRKNTNTSWTAAANALTDSTKKSAKEIIKNSSGINISNFDTDSTYLVYAVLVDNYNQSIRSPTVTVFGASRIFNIMKDGTGVAFGKLAEKKNILESRWPLQVDDAIFFGKTGTPGKLYTYINSEETNIIYVQTGQSVDNGTDMRLGISKYAVYVENENNDGKVKLGLSSRKWAQLYAASGTILTSDRNAKTNIVDMENTQEQLFNKLRPVTFKLKDGSSGRTHYGFISQDVEDSLGELKLTGRDFAGFCKDLRIDENGEAILDENGNEIYDYSLRYSEFVALNTHMIQKLQNEIAGLKAEIAELKSTIQN